MLSQELDIRRLAEVLQRMREQRVDFVELAVPSPFALPLMVERFREKLTTEKLKDRLERMLRDMETEALRREPRSAEREPSSGAFTKPLATQHVMSMGRQSSSIQAGAWSLGFSRARTARSTPAARRRLAAGALSSRWSMRSPASRLKRLRK